MRVTSEEHKPLVRKALRRVQRSAIATHRKRLVPRGPRSQIAMRRNIQVLKERPPELVSLITTHRSIRAPKAQPRELPGRIAMLHNTLALKAQLLEPRLIIITRRSIRVLKAQPRERQR